jgi:opacity protein-like surface antigen
MKKALQPAVALLAIVISGAAAGAADLPVGPAPAPIYAPMFFSWTGVYAGANVGGVTQQGSVSDSLVGGSASLNRSGVVGGVQIGYNYQLINAAVVGVEGTFDGTSLNATSAAGTPAAGAFQVSASSRWLASVAARLGAVADHWMVYGKAGAAWVDNSFTTNTTTGPALASTSSISNGWMVGVGIEYAFTVNWSAKLEYDFIELAHWSTPGILPNDTLSVTRQIQTLTFGANYRFDWGAPLIARY